MIHVKALTKAHITHGTGQFVVSKAAVLQSGPWYVNPLAWNMNTIDY